jgi:hypothetical protein
MGHKRYFFWLVILVAMLAMPLGVYGQEHCDLMVQESGIHPDQVVLAQPVQLEADINNLWVCYIDLMNGNEHTKYDFSTSQAITGIKIEVRMRSRGGTANADVWVDNRPPLPASVSTGSTSWVVLSATYPSVALISGSHILHFEMTGGAADVDWRRLRKLSDNSIIATVQAENYRSDSQGVDSVHPSLVWVRFYEGPVMPANQIGPAQIASDSEAELQTGPMPYLSGGGTATVTVEWIPEVLGPQDVYVVIDPDPEGEEDYNNNEAFKPIEVVEGCVLVCPEGDGQVIASAGTGVRSPDINGDGTVDLIDLTLFAMAYPPQPYDHCIDYNCDGDITLPDLAMFAFHFGPPGHTGPNPGYCTP